MVKLLLYELTYFRPGSLRNIRARVGSSFATSGGVILVIDSLTYMSSYNPITLDNDIGIVRTLNNGIFFVANAIQPGNFASANYIVPDNSLVTIAGWGRTEVRNNTEHLPVKLYSQCRGYARW